MAAVRVPPSAWMTSQSTVKVRSPKRSRLATARRLRPISRWISWVRPPMRPVSRAERVLVLRGSMAYSAVIQPAPLPRRKDGTRSSIETAQSTRVRPRLINTEPSACTCTPVSMVRGRSWRG